MPTKRTNPSPMVTRLWDKLLGAVVPSQEDIDHLIKTIAQES